MCRGVSAALWSGILVLGVGAGLAQTGQSRVRHEREWDAKAAKMETHLLPTMRKHGIDMWILMSRENHPDPILDLFGGYGVSGWYGHRNAYIFYDAGPEHGLETTVIGTHLSDHSKRFFVNIVPYGRGGLAPLLRRRTSRYPHPQRPSRRHRRQQKLPPGRPHFSPPLSWHSYSYWLSYSYS